ncbi:MAG: hypothetical protein R3F14_15645 [Polyangiaceae bacterium]
MSLLVSPSTTSGLVLNEANSVASAGKRPIRSCGRGSIALNDFCSSVPSLGCSRMDTRAPSSSSDGRTSTRSRSLNVLTIHESTRSDTSDCAPGTCGEVAICCLTCSTISSISFEYSFETFFADR